VAGVARLTSEQLYAREPRLGPGALGMSLCDHLLLVDPPDHCVCMIQLAYLCLVSVSWTHSLSRCCMCLWHNSWVLK
jgi:hypothetical protein